MPATCAICLNPIVARNDVRVFGTEVMHRACAMSGRETIGQRQERELAEMRCALVTAQEGERRQSVALHQERRRAMNSQRAAVLADERLDNAGAERDEAVSRQVRAEMERDAALRERNVARAELVKRTPAPDSTPSTADDSNASEIRFSLLELD